MASAGLESVSTDLLSIFFACARHQHVHTLTLWQLCGTFQRSAEVWVNWILSSGFIVICLSEDQKADTSQTLKPHSWQRRSVGTSSFIWLWDNAWLFYLPSVEEDKRIRNTSSDSNLYSGDTVHSQCHLQCSIISPAFVTDAKFSFFSFTTANQTLCHGKSAMEKKKSPSFTYFCCSIFHIVCAATLNSGYQPLVMSH